MVQRRLEELQTVPHLAVNQDAENLAQKLIVDRSASEEGGRRCLAYRGCDSSRDGLSVDVEL